MDQQQKDYFYGRKWTLKGNMYYPALFQPNQKDDGRLQYSLMFAWMINDPAQQATVNEIFAFLQQAKQQLFPQYPDQNFIMPIKQWGVYQKEDGTAVQPFLENKFWLNANASGGTAQAPDTRFKPTVVDQNKQEILDPAMVYSGANCLLNLSFYAYDGRSRQGKVGIGANIGAVMVIPGGEKVVTGGVNLDEAFAGFQADMGVGAGGAFPNGMGHGSGMNQVPAGNGTVAPSVAPQQVQPTNPNQMGGYANPVPPSNPATPQVQPAQPAYQPQVQPAVPAQPVQQPAQPAQPNNPWVQPTNQFPN